jgi:hypothetical protein
MSLKLQFVATLFAGGLRTSARLPGRPFFERSSEGVPMETARARAAAHVSMPTNISLCERSFITAHYAE